MLVRVIVFLFKVPDHRCQTKHLTFLELQYPLIGTFMEFRNADRGIARLRNYDMFRRVVRGIDL